MSRVIDIVLVWNPGNLALVLNMYYTYMYVWPKS